MPIEVEIIWENEHINEPNINRILKNSGIPNMLANRDHMVSHKYNYILDKISAYGDIFTDDVPQYIYIYEDVPRQLAEANGVTGNPTGTPFNNINLRERISTLYVKRTTDIVWDHSAYLADPSNVDYDVKVNENDNGIRPTYHYAYFRIFLTGSGIGSTDSVVQVHIPSKYKDYVALHFIPIGQRYGQLLSNLGGTANNSKNNPGGLITTYYDRGAVDDDRTRVDDYYWIDTNPLTGAPMSSSASHINLDREGQSLG